MYYPEVRRGLLYRVVRRFGEGGVWSRCLVVHSLFGVGRCGGVAAGRRGGGAVGLCSCTDGLMCVVAHSWTMAGSSVEMCSSVWS